MGKDGEDMVLWRHTACPKSSWGLFLQGGWGWLPSHHEYYMWALRHIEGIPVWIGSHPAVTPNPAGFILILRAFIHFPSISSLPRIPLEPCRHGRGRGKAHLWKTGTCLEGSVNTWARGWVDGWNRPLKAGPESLLVQNKINRPFISRWSQVVVERAWDRGLTNSIRNITLRTPLICSHNVSYSRLV